MFSFLIDFLINQRLPYLVYVLIYFPGMVHKLKLVTSYMFMCLNFSQLLSLGITVTKQYTLFTFLPSITTLCRKMPVKEIYRIVIAYLVFIVS